jgi:hypothetical protein
MIDPDDLVVGLRALDRPRVPDVREQRFDRLEVPALGRGKELAELGDRDELRGLATERLDEPFRRTGEVTDERGRSLEEDGLADADGR